MYRVQSYSRDKTDCTVQSRKLSYSREISADIGLKSPLYIDIGRSSHILRLMVKFEKSMWKHLHIYCAFRVLILFRKNRYSPPTKFETRKMPFSLSPLPYNVVSQQVCIFMYRLYQYTNPVNASCALISWVFNLTAQMQTRTCPRTVRLLRTGCTSY